MLRNLFRERNTLALGIVLCLLAATPAAAQRSARQIERGSDLAAHDSDVAIYWKGDFGIPPATFDGAAKQLSDNFVAVVVENIDGESIVIEGTRYSGFEAVTGSIQYRLLSDPTFLGMVDEHGTPRMSVIVLSLDSSGNRLDYFPSPLHERYGLTRSSILLRSGSLHPVIAEFKRQKDAGKFLPAILGMAEELDRQLAEAVRAEAARKAAAARTIQVLTWLLIVGFISLSAVVLLVLRRRREKAEAELQALLRHWNTVLSAKRPGLLTLRRKVLSTQQLLPKDLAVDSETHAAFNDARKSIGRLVIMLHKGQEVLDSVDGEAAAKFSWWQRTFTAGPYLWALGRLQAADAIRYDARSALRFRLEQETLSDEEMLGVSASAFEPFATSFEKFDADVVSISEAARPKLEAVRSAVFGAGKALKEARQALEGAAVSRNTARKLLPPRDRGRITAFAGVFAPAAASQLDTVEKITRSDPVRALRLIAEIRGRIDQVRNALEDLVEASAADAEIPRILGHYDELAAAERKPGWILSGITGVLDSIGEYCRSLSAMDGSAPALDVSDKFREILARAGQAASACRSWAEQRPLLDAVQAEAAAARAELAAAHGLAPDAIMTEPDPNPDEAIDQARRSGATLLDEIDEGDIGEVSKLASRILELHQRAQRVIAATRAAFDSFDADLQAQTDAVLRLTSDATQREEVLEQLLARFDADTFALLQADAGFGVADRSAANNAAEMLDAARRRDEHLRLAGERRAEGHVLTAQAHVESAAAENGFIAALITQVDAVKLRIETQLRKNAEALADLSSRSGSIAKLMQQPHVTVETQRRFDRESASNPGAKQLLARASAASRNPFLVRDLLAKVRTAFDAVEQSAAIDRERMEEALRGIASAKRQIAALDGAVEAARRHPAPDSEKTQSAATRGSRWTAELRRLQEGSTVAHSDWAALGGRAAAILGEAQALTGVVKAELAAAKSAEKAIGRARGRVDAAISWRGDYAVLNGKPGSGRLDAAEMAYSQARYTAAQDLADEAYDQADRAIDRAEAEESRLRSEALFSDDDDDDDFFGGISVGGRAGGSWNSSSRSSSPSPGLSLGGFRPSGGVSLGGSFRPSSGISI